MDKRPSVWLIAFYTALALFAFAGNSLLNRMALGSNSIDALSFISIRLVAGAITLWLINGFYNKTFILNFKNNHFSKYIKSAIFLFVYGITFSLAYQSLTTSMGALILFGSVQFTMLCFVFFKGEKQILIEWVGLILAFSGLIYLLLPGLAAPSFYGAVLMLIAGISWTFYTLNGKGIQNPLEATMYNFVFTIPLVILLIIFNFNTSQVTQKGMILACISGAITSGIGYSLWYKALAGLSNMQAGLLQLCVPIIAAFGGVIILNENITNRILLAGLFIIGGVLLSILGNKIQKR